MKDYKPIACCYVIYKLISKVLTSRPLTVVGDVVSDAQTGFIPGRSIVDNILLASELIKGYTRKHISPRSMIKIDLRKAYDSLEWPFLKTMLQELGFPSIFVGWIMECLSTVSYSLLVNGYPTGHIHAILQIKNLDRVTLSLLFYLPLEWNIYLDVCCSGWHSWFQVSS